MASAERLASGKWRGVYRDANKKKCHTPAPHYDRKRDATAAANALEVDSRRRSAPTGSSLKFPPTTEWGVFWDYLVAARHTTDATTSDTEIRLVRCYIRPRWGKVPYNEILPDDVRTWVGKLSDGTAPKDVDPRWEDYGPLKPSVVRRIFAVFSMTITKAIDEKIILMSPIVRPGLPKKPRPQSNSRRYLTVVECDKIRPFLPPEIADMMDFGMETGLRPSELCGLHKQFADRETGFALIRDVLVQGRNVVRPCTKSGDERLVPLTPKALEIVDRRAKRSTRPTCGLEHTRGSTCASDLLFRSASGKPISVWNFNYHLAKACQRACVPRASGYPVRRGAATRIGRGGMNIFDFSRMFGWSDIQIAWSYVQQSPDVREKLLVAMGVTREQWVVPGGPEAGTPPGTDPNSPTLAETAIHDLPQAG